MPDRRSLLGLDGLNFFTATVQTGFGPFIAVYLAGQKWTQVEIGVALSIGSIAAMLGQVPGGALVDAVLRKRQVALVSLLAIALSALVFAAWPARAPVFLAQIIHGLASCTLGPAIAAMTLLIVGPAGLGERLGRNGRYAAIGNGLAAAAMGLFGTYGAQASVFVLTAALAVPAMVAALMVGEPPHPRHLASHGGTLERNALRALLVDRRLLLFAACVVLFHLSNAAMLPLAGAEMTRQAGSAANLLIAAAIVVPQLLVAAISPWVGRAAELHGRRPILLLGFAALPLRASLLALLAWPEALVAVQALEGVSAAVFGIMLPLVAADLTRGTRRFNLCQGILGLAMGIGATLSTVFAGAIADLLGRAPAFFALAAAGMAATLLLALAMPETRPAPAIAPGPSTVPGAAQ